MVNLRNADLLFVRKSEKTLSKIIVESTQERYSKGLLDYYHVAILEKRDSGTLIFHATPEHGCVCQRLEQFITGESIIDVYRSNTTGHFKSR